MTASYKANLLCDFMVLNTFSCIITTDISTLIIFTTYLMKKFLLEQWLAVYGRAILHLHKTRCPPWNPFLVDIWQVLYLFSIKAGIWLIRGIQQCPRQIWIPLSWTQVQKNFWLLSSLSNTKGALFPFIWESQEWHSWLRWKRNHNFLSVQWKQKKRKSFLSSSFFNAKL